VVALVATPAADQVAWLVEEGLEADELALMFLDVVPSWLPPLRAAALITSAAENALVDVETALEALLETTDSSLFTDHAVRTAPQWQQLRELAGVSLQELHRPG
jgi:hypothetical protein